MMGWDIANFNVSRGGGIARGFEFEVVFTGSGRQPECLLHGDGVVLSTGRVRFNREDDLRALVAEAGGNPQYFLDYLSDWVVRQSRRELPLSA